MAGQVEAAGILSRLLGDPESLKATEAREAVEILRGLHPEDWAGHGSDPEGFREAWNREKDIFIGNASFLSLEESVYKAWTSDRSHPLNGAKGFAWGDPAQHMQDVLGELGLALNPAESRAPDNLAVLLEFLAFLLKNRSQKEARSFCRDHLDWLDDLRREAEEKGVGGVLILLVRTAERLVQTLVSQDT